MGYTSTLSFVDDSYKGAAPAQNSLNMTITPTFANNTLGTPLKNNTLFNYNVAVLNLDKTRGQSGVLINFRPPSCLVLNSKTLSSSTLIQSFNYDMEQNEVQMYIRNLKAGETRTIPVQLTQVSNGKCTIRPSTVQYLNSGDEVVTARPAY